MERKKIRTLLLYSAIAFILIAVVILLAACIYFGAMQLAAPASAACSAVVASASPVIMSGIFSDPLLTWILVAAAVILAVFIIIFIIALSLRSKKKKKNQAEAAAGYGDELASGITYGNDKEPAVPAGIAPLDYASEESVRSASDAADAFIAAQSGTGKAPAGNTDELLVKYIRDVNETADKYRDINSRLTAYIDKRNRLKEKASDIQKRLFKSYSLEIINRYSMTLNKIYKLISKYDGEIASYRKKKAVIADELKELRRAANTYITLHKILLAAVAPIEDEIVYDIALSKRLVEESGYFNSPLGGSTGDKINEKRREIAEQDAEGVYWEQSISEAADEDVKLDGLIKLLDIEEKTDALRDELVSLMTEVTEEPEYKSIDEITETVKREIRPGSGIVTRDLMKLNARKSTW